MSDTLADHSTVVSRDDEADSGEVVACTQQAEHSTSDDSPEAHKRCQYCSLNALSASVSGSQSGPEVSDLSAAVLEFQDSPDHPSQFSHVPLNTNISPLDSGLLDAAAAKGQICKNQDYQEATIATQLS